MKSRNEPLPVAARAALEQGRSIEAIKILRAQTGLGLSEARTRIEVAQRRMLANRAPSDGSLPPAAIAALQRGRVIEAVKAVRAVRGEGLKAAKAEVDRYRATHPEMRHPLQNNESHGGRTLLIGALIAAAVWFWLR